MGTNYYCMHRKKKEAMREHAWVPKQEEAKEAQAVAADVLLAHGVQHSWVIVNRDNRPMSSWGGFSGRQMRHFRSRERAEEALALERRQARGSLVLAGASVARVWTVVQRVEGED